MDAFDAVMTVDGIERGFSMKRLVVIGGFTAPVAGADKPVFIPLGFGTFVDSPCGSKSRANGWPHRLS